MFQRFSSLVNGRTATFNSTVQNFKPRVILLQLPRLPILQQLLLEEALYRRSKSLESTGWVLYNDFTAPVAPDKEPVKKSIILGRSQRPHDVVNAEAVTRDSVDMIRRYSVRKALRVAYLGYCVWLTRAETA